MGFFNEVGRQVEQFKQTVQATVDESAAYRCSACDERFHSRREQCPECGATEIEPVADK